SGGHTVARRRGDVVGEAEARYLREAALPGVAQRCRVDRQRDTVLEHRLQTAAVHVERYDDVPEGEHGQGLAARDRERRRRVGRAEVPGADGTAVGTASAEAPRV